MLQRNKRDWPHVHLAGRSAFRMLSSEAWPREHDMSLGTIILIILILLLIGALPTWPYSSSWGYAPTGGLGLVVVIVIVLLVMGRI
jgi:hypothetical protein